MLALAGSTSFAQGIAWTSRSLAQRNGLAMAYDSQRGVTVVFGGDGGPRDTWELGSTGWVQRATDGPPARSIHAMVYDSRRHVVVLFGGTNSYASSLADTWEWDGVSWTERHVSGPPARYGHGMAYDSQRGVTVLFGGSNYVGDTTTTYADTWEWDGIAWVLRPGSGPSSGGSMAFDAQRGVSVMFNGSATWEWDGQNWAQRATTGPSARFQHTLAYDSLRHVTVLFGGGSGGNVQGDTWEWNGSAWSQRSTTGATARNGHAMVFDSQRGVSLVVGGAPISFSPNTLNNEAGWEWNGTAWSRRTYPDAPARFAHGMVYDSQRAATLIFGGYSGSAYLGDTWQWDGTGWSQRATTGPSARRYLAMCYDSARGVVVLFGGTSATSTLGDTWEWNGSSWTQRASSGPPARYGHALAYDSRRGVCVLFGGTSSGSNYFGDTWEWNGLAWTQRQVTGPSARYYTAMAYDSQRGVCVLVGGRSAASTYLGDTWEWDGTVWSLRSATGPEPRNATALAYDTAHGRTILFGGADAGSFSGRFLANLYLWDGTAWTLRFRDNLWGRHSTTLAYDSQRDTVVMFGGLSGTGSYAFGDTWEARLLPCLAPSIVTQPVSHTTCASGSATFTVQAHNAGAQHYEWQFQIPSGSWQALSGSPYSGLCTRIYAYPYGQPTSTVVVRPCSGSAGASQTFHIRCVVTDAGFCSSTSSNVVNYTVCPADVNCSGATDTQDILDFLDAWFAGSAAADINGGGLTVKDIFDFLRAWFAAC